VTGQARGARVAAVAGVAFGAFWLAAAAAKLARPAAAYELAARAVPPGVSGKALVAAVVGLEAALGAAMCLRAVRGLGPSLAALAALSAALLAVRVGSGPAFPCGCFGNLLGRTVDEALLRNAALAAVHVALLVGARRRPNPAAG
jgi:hypothetical protein